MKNENLKTNKTKLIAKLMLVVMLLSLVATTGCSLIPQKTTEENKHHEPEDLVNGMLAKMQAAGYEEMEEMAEFYFQCPYINSTTNYTVKIVDGKIYLHGYIFDDISYVTDYLLIYESSLLSYASNRDVEKYEMLLKIQNSSECYILIPQEENGVGFKIVVYEIEGDYYFLASYYNDEVQKIHKVTID